MSARSSLSGSHVSSSLANANSPMRPSAREHSATRHLFRDDLRPCFDLRPADAARFFFRSANRPLSLVGADEKSREIILIRHRWKSPKHTSGLERPAATIFAFHELV